MALRSEDSTTPPRRRSPVAELALLFLAGVALALWRVGVADAAPSIGARLSAGFGPGVVTAVVYGTLTAAAVVAVGGFVLRSADAGPSLDPADLVRLPALAWILSVLLWYLLVGDVDAGAVPVDLLEALLGTTVAMGALAVGYARATGLDLRYHPPSVGAAPVIGAAIAGGMIAGAFQPLSGHLLGWTDGATVFDGFGLGPSSLETLLASAVVIPVAVGIGRGLVFNGVVQQRVRERGGPAVAVAAATALAATFGTTALPIQREGTAVLLGTAAAGTGVALVAAAVAGTAVSRLESSRDGRERASTGLAVGVAGAVAVVAATGYWLLVNGLLYFVTGESLLSTLLLAVGFAAAAAVASTAYERVRSVWVPVLAYAAFGTGSTLAVEVLFAGPAL